MTTPTLQELAALAASLPTGNPAERAQAALELWNACARALQPPAAPDPFSDWMLLDKLLAQVSPTRDAADRMKLWRDFLPAWEEKLWSEYKGSVEARLGTCVILDEPSEAELTRRAEDAMSHHRAHGVSDATKIGIAFIAWNKERAARIRTERGKKGHAAKKALEVEASPKNRTSKSQPDPKRATKTPKRETAPRKRK